MCLSMKAPKIAAPPPPAMLQAMQSPKDFTQNARDGGTARRRRGLWATVFTGPQGIAGPPTVTGSSGGITGG